MQQKEIDSYNQKGFEAMQKAEKKLKGGFFKNLTSSKEERFE